MDDGGFGLLGEAGQYDLNVLRDVDIGFQRNGLTQAEAGGVVEQSRVLQGAEQKPGEDPDVRDAIQKFLWPAECKARLIRIAGKVRRTRIFRWEQKSFCP